MTFKQKLDLILEQDEGKKLKPYKCSEGKLTIGIGHNLEAKGISEAVCQLMLEEDRNEAIDDAKSLVTNFDELPDNVKIVLSSMVFQMGKRGVSQFVNMLRAVESGEYETASLEMLDSLWAKQTPNRAIRLSKMMESA